MSHDPSLAVQVTHLDFGYGGPQILRDVNLSLERGSRCLLIGANGAGKSTLLKVLSGKRLTKGNIKALGKNPFFEGSVGVTYLGTEWALNPVVHRELAVARLLKTMGAERHPERCARLLEILDVNPDWTMNEVSDGQRRRVQIVLGLLEPWDLLLMDEVTVDLDVLVRSNLLKFLKEETESRQATIIYATHIFDGIGGWPTHVAHMWEGQIDLVRDVNEGFPELEEERDRLLKSGSTLATIDNSPLLCVVEKWLAADYQKRGLTGRRNPEGKVMTKWDILSENMRAFGDKYYNYYTNKD
ncbi:P-loop containing nucleoside triphosphate hydrolase protein [Polychytrium aggregatum]|uniref:P-loop containing nucleoside triphosphate hydrolase protein n=1 Tax=Polychytrium aggregatum TaxID=110093 RepID=UPI0022FEF365|nr:P-loop containing nucleoside triphosphate hydrolase protein [Polychytrium aggregatum]KAI9209675.1 P-loop containing nucleoside triphosphate hydrolase protein [Polychytrium aggregatum]